MTSTEEPFESTSSLGASVGKQNPRSDDVVWDQAFPLLTNPFVMLDMGKVLGLAFLIVCLILLAIGAWPGGSSVADMLHMIPVMAICVGVIAVIMLFVMLVLYRNRFPARFTVSREGAGIEVTPTQKTSNTAIIILGLLAGKPGVAGSGFLAKSQERQFFGWVDVHRVALFPRRRAVVLMNGWRTVARLYCTADTYESVVRLAGEGVERTACDRERNTASARKSRSRLGRDVFNPWLALVVVSFILAGASPLLSHVGPLWGIGVVVLLGLVTGRHVRLFFGVAGLVMIAAVVLLMVMEGAKVHSYAGGYVKFSNFESATSGDHLRFFLFSVFGMLGLTACSVRNIVSGRRHD